ncbi:MAG: S8 family peptidase [Deltaproteobacteria bacterium]
MKKLIAVLHLCVILSLAQASNPPLQHPFKPADSGTDPLMKKAWHLKRIKAFEAWKKVQGRQEMTLAIIDSGINYNHPEVAPNLKRKTIEWPSNGVDKDENGFIDDIIGWDFVKGSFLPFDRTGHGTFVAAIAAGAINNGVGASGVCPKCSIMPLRFLNYEGLGDTEDAIKGIYYAAKERVAAINLSFAGEGYDQELFDAINTARKNDVVVVVSSGNDGENIEKSSVYPAKFKLPNQLTVAASTEEDELLESSNWGHTTVHIAAPGDEIIGPWLNEWDTNSGTSFSAAVVTGAVGLVRSANPKLTAEQVVKIIKNTAEKVEPQKNKTVTGGILDVAAAVNCATERNLSCLK